MKFNPTSAEGQAIAALFSRCKEVEEGDGGWPGADIVQELTVWFDQLGINVDAGMEQLDGTTAHGVEQAAKVHLSWDGTRWAVDRVNVDGAPLDAVYDHALTENCSCGDPVGCARTCAAADRAPLPTGREVGAALLAESTPDDGDLDRDLVVADDLVIVDDQVDIARRCYYALTRVYRIPDSGRTLRVRIRRDVNGTPYAVGEVLTDALTWTELVAAPRGWTTRLPWPGSEDVDEFMAWEKLDPVARLLVERAVTVLPPTHQ